MTEYEQAIARVRSETMASLMQRQPKYRWWKLILQYGGPIIVGPTKGKMVESDYLVQRRTDDIADGDWLPPKGYSPSLYIAEKIDFLRNPRKPKDDIERVMLYCQELSEQVGLDLKEERILIMQSVLFDADRKGKDLVFPKAVLNEHFYRCDIEGTGKGVLKLFGEDPNKYKLVEPLGVAARIHDNLLDFRKDVDGGFINIPLEDVEYLEMTPEDIRDMNSPKVQDWLKQESQRATVLLAQDRELFPQGNFGFFGKLFVDLYFRRPAVTYFGKLAKCLESGSTNYPGQTSF